MIERQISFIVIFIRFIFGIFEILKGKKNENDNIKFLF